MNYLMPFFPREIGFPQRRIVKNENHLYSLINKYNKLKDIYYSIYSCDKNHDFGKPLIDKLAFDFDGEDLNLVLKDIRKFIEYLENNDYRFLVCFSGKKGFHIYVFCINGEQLLFPKDALYNAHVFLKNTVGIHPDEKLFGDIKRILRIPNTWHTTGKRYCIPLIKNDLDKGIEWIKEKALKQCFKFKIYGEKYFDIKMFDNEKEKIRPSDIPVFDNDIDCDEAIKHFLPCVKCWLLDIDKMGTFEARYQFAVYCREIGISKNDCDKFARKYFSKVINTGSLNGRGSNYDHFVKVKALDYAYNKGDFFWNCETLFMKKLCPGRCQFFKKNGSPLYK